MKIFSFTLLMILAFASCKNATSETKSEEAQGETYAGDKPETPVVRLDLNGITQHVGKKPKDVDLFSTFSLDGRIEKIMGSDFAEFKKDWNEETPLIKDGEVIYTTGCRAGDCNSNRYLLILDVLQNGINVFNFKGAKTKSYEEDNTIIGMPSQVQAEFERILNEQKAM